MLFNNLKHRIVNMKFIRTEEVINKTGMSRTSIWRMEKDGEFPCRRQLGLRSVGWLETEIDEWIESRKKVDTYESGVEAVLEREKIKMQIKKQPGTHGRWVPSQAVKP